MSVRKKKTRAAKISSRRRSEIARNAARARWGYETSEADSELKEDDQAKEEVVGLVPLELLKGKLELGESAIDCSVLNNGVRVLSLRTSVKAISGKETGKLMSYLGNRGLRGFIDAEEVKSEIVTYRTRSTDAVVLGLPAETFLKICEAYVSALREGTLKTKRQHEIAITCVIMLSSCARVGLVALIDEATGYQLERSSDALELKLRAYIADEMREWEKTFPDELWREFGRLTGRNDLRRRPRWWGKLVMELIYHALDPDIAEHLRTKCPPPRGGQKYHQWLSQDIGLKALMKQIHQVIGIAKMCTSMSQLREEVAKHYGHERVQLTVYVPKKETSSTVQSDVGALETLPKRGASTVCKVCGHDPMKSHPWHKCCTADGCTTSADSEEEIERLFGFRKVRSGKEAVLAPQSRCKRHR